MTGETFQREYLKCPHCGQGEFQVSHLTAAMACGPWYCDDCGGSFVCKRQTDRSISVELRDERKVTTVDVLVLNPQDKPVYFVVHGMRFTGPTVTERLWRAAGNTGPYVDDRDADDSKRFFYESHSCPTNWLEPVMVYHDGDSDPHGLLEYVRSVDLASLPPDESWGPNGHDAAIVALIEEPVTK